MCPRLCVYVACGGIFKRDDGRLKGDGACVCVWGYKLATIIKANVARGSRGKEWRGQKEVENLLLEGKFGPAAGVVAAAINNTPTPNHFSCTRKFFAPSSLPPRGWCKFSA